MRQTIEFKASDNLLKDVITRQAGTPFKGIMELLQNSLDGITVQKRTTPRLKGKIEIDTESSGDGSILIFSDNGCGLGKSKADVVRNFSIFGLGSKKDDSELLGEFSMGRGQAISMIYNPELDRLDGDIKVYSNGHILSNFRVDDQLTFDIDKNPDSKVRGTKWVIKSNKSYFFSDMDIEGEFGKNVRTDVKVTLNGYELDGVTPKGKLYDDPEFSLWMDKGSSDFEVFDRVLKVSTIDVVSGWGGTIVSKVPLKQNFARNTVIDGDSVMGKAIQLANELITDEINSLTSKSRLNDFKRKGIIEIMKTEVGHGSPILPDIKVFTLTNGKKVSFNDLRGKEIHSGSKGDGTADKLIQMGIPVMDIADMRALEVVRKGLSTSVNHYKKAGQGTRAYNFLKTLGAKKIDKEIELTDEDKIVLWIFNKVYRTKREILLGESKIYDGWTDGSTYIYLNATRVRREVKFHNKGRKSLLHLLVSLSGLMAHEEAHDNDDTVTMEHSYDFDKAEIKQRDRMISGILALSQEDLAKYEVELGWRDVEEALPEAANVPEPKPRYKKGSRGYQMDEPPKWFTEVAERIGGTVETKKRSISAKLGNHKNIGTLLSRRGKWILVFNGVMNMGGTVPMKAYHNFSSIPVDDPKAKNMYTTYALRVKNRR